MVSLFHESMSSKQAEKIFFEYAAKHKGEDLREVKEDYIKFLKIIVARELEEDDK